MLGSLLYVHYRASLGDLNEDVTSAREDDDEKKKVRWSMNVI